MATGFWWRAARFFSSRGNISPIPSSHTQLLVHSLDCTSPGMTHSLRRWNITGEIRTNTLNKTPQSSEHKGCNTKGINLNLFKQLFNVGEKPELFLDYKGLIGRNNPLNGIQQISTYWFYDLTFSLNPCHNHCFISNIKHFVTLVCITYDLMSLLPLFSLTNAALGRYKGIVSFLLPTTSFLTIPTCLTWVLLMSHMSLYMFLSPVWASGLWIPPGCLVRVHPPWRVRLPPLLQACKAPAPLQTHSSPSSPESLPSLRLPHLHLEKGFGKSPWRPWPSLLHASTRVRFYCHHHHYHHLALVLGRVNHASIHMQCFHLFFWSISLNMFMSHSVLNLFSDITHS